VGQARRRPTTCWYGSEMLLRTAGGGDRGLISRERAALADGDEYLSFVLWRSGEIAAAQKPT
jgi:hypothetical protein